MAVLELIEISKKYRDLSKFAVNKVSLKVRHGDILALVGESGSGKTTLLRMIAGLEHPDGGKILLNEVTMVSGQLSVPPNHRNVGLMFQDYALFPHLNIFENIVFGLKKGTKSEKRIKVKEMMDFVKLNEDPTKYPGQLSGGQQQRVALARALAPNPKLLLLDEPFSNLDAVLKERVRRDVREIIKSTGITTIIVTHDTKDALSTADQIAVMHEGELLQTATPSEIYNGPQRSYVAKLFGKFNLVAFNQHAGAWSCAYGAFPHYPQFDGLSSPAKMFFRPSHVTILSEELPDMGLHLKGVVTESTYLGDSWELKVNPLGSAAANTDIWLTCADNQWAAPGTIVRFQINNFQIWKG